MSKMDRGRRKNTKYFLNLEKKRAGSNTIKQVRKDNGEIVTDPSKILVEAQKYYGQFLRGNNI